MDTSLSALPPNRFGYAQAQHLLIRAGFGGTPRQIAALQALGLERAVASLVDYSSIAQPVLPSSEASNAPPTLDPDLVRPLTPEERMLYVKARRDKDEATLEKLQAERNRREREDRQQMRSVEHWWLGRMIATPRPLEEKLTLLWHGHFASNYRTVRDSFLMWKQNQLFRTHAAASFADLVRGIVRDPAMIRFLDNNTNRKGRPNENLARELMELFTLGEGHYSEQDIKEGARALTGYNYADNDFVFEDRYHDAGTKTILGRKGEFDGERFAALLLEQPACPRFLALKLYRHFVGDLPDGVTPEVRPALEELARLVIAHRYRIAPVLTALFQSRHFYDPAVMGGMIKSPVQLVVSAVRTLNTPARDLRVLCESLDLMGQQLFEPPTVAGWDGGAAWINTATLFIRQNLAAYLLTGKLPNREGWTAQKIDYDPMILLEGLPEPSPQSVVDHLTPALLGSRPLPERREQLVRFMKERKPGITRDTVLALMLLITSTPEYQLC